MRIPLTTKEATWSFLLVFSLPSVLSSFLEPLASLVDTMVLGQSETTWLAALGLAMAIINSLTWIFNFLVHVSTQSVSGPLGVGDSLKASDAARISLSMSLYIGVGASLMMLLGKPVFYSMINVESVGSKLVDEYYVLRSFGQVFLILYATGLSLIRALGLVQLSFGIVIITTGANVVLTMALVNVLGWGLRGAALGSVAANALGFLVVFYVLNKRLNLVGWWRVQNLRGPQAIKFGSQSLNMMGRTACLVISFFLATRAASKLGESSLAAHQILLQLWLAASFLVDGVAISANILVSRYIQSKQYDLLAHIVKKLLLIGSAIGVGFTVLYLFVLPHFWSLFSHDLNVQDQLNQLIWLIGGAQIVAAVTFVLDGVLFGLGAFSYLRHHLMLGLFIIFLPVLYLSPFQWGLYSVWPAIIGLAIYRLTMYLKKCYPYLSYGKKI